MIKIASPVLPKREGEVVYPVSYRYNGGITVDREWHEGYEVGAPVVPQGYRLVSLGIGLQMNAQPPLATMYLKKDG